MLAQEELRCSARSPGMSTKGPFTFARKKWEQKKSVPSARRNEGVEKRSIHLRIGHLTPSMSKLIYLLTPQNPRPVTPRG